MAKRRLYLSVFFGMTFILVIGAAALTLPEEARAFTANKVWFEIRPEGFFRVYASYTVPELKEFREAYVVFTNKKDAEKYYWDLIKGADFYLPEPGGHRFLPNSAAADPW